MSRWLKGLDQVTSLMERLDDRVATVAETRAYLLQDEDEEDDIPLAEILSKRGLEFSKEEEEEEEEEEVDNEVKGKDVAMDEEDDLEVEASTGHLPQSKDEANTPAPNVSEGNENSHDDDDNNNNNDETQGTGEASTWSFPDEIPLENQDDVEVPASGITTEHALEKEVIVNKINESSESKEPANQLATNSTASVAEDEEATDHANENASNTRDEDMQQDPSVKKRAPDASFFAPGAGAAAATSSSEGATTDATVANLVATETESPLNPTESTSNTSAAASKRSLFSQAPAAVPALAFVKAMTSKKASTSMPNNSNHSANQNLNKSKKEQELLTATKEAQKEVRVLRKHVVKLNSTLENAEQEIQALRAELDRAATRMEQDRTKAKQDLHQVQERQKQELIKQQQLHKEALQNQQHRWEQQLAHYQTQLKEMESKRKEEGVDWSKEMTQAMQREQEMSSRVAMLEDEKAVLESHIATLTSQQEALGSRLESLTQTSENALDRERDAEDRLDAALSQHARQISQRQAREAELERIIQELNAALVQKAGSSEAASAGGSGDGGSSPAALQARIESLEVELEHAHSQWNQEKERCDMLHQQLKEMSKESSQEASSVQVQLLKYQRQVAEMSVTISKLEANLREAQNASSSNGHQSSGNLGSTSTAEEDEMARQVKMLSEEVLKLRDKLANSSGELMTLKSRLQTALERASKAEDELANATAYGGGGDMYDSMERAVGGAKSRRKQGIGGNSTSNAGTIRSAMRLHSGQGDRTEQLGMMVDALDSFAVTTGKYLRRNPIARAAFILYLIAIHLWSFVLLFFHAHNFETNRDYTAPMMAVGPGAMIEQHKQAADQVAAEIHDSLSNGN